MNLLFLRNYNNYFNNTLKHYSGTLDGLAAFESRHFSNINFNPNNDVNTSLIVNWDMDWMPDYVFASSDDINIDSSWFIINYVRTRNGQYNLTLKRDTLNDFYDEMAAAKGIIYKAKLNVDNKLIYNSEGSSVNQIKTNSIQLKDKSGVPWIVGYLVQDNKAYPDAGAINASSDVNLEEAVSWTSLDFTPVANETVTITDVKTNNNTKIVFNVNYGHPGSSGTYLISYYPYTDELKYGTSASYKKMKPLLFIAATAVNFDDFLKAVKSTFSSIRNNVITSIATYYPTAYSVDDVDMTQYEAYFLSKDSLNTYYNLSVALNTKENSIKKENSENFTDLTTLFKNILDSKISGLTWYNNNLGIHASNIVAYNVKATVNYSGSYSTHIPSGRAHLNDMPYDMFCIPYGELKGGVLQYEGSYFDTSLPSGTATLTTTSKDAAMAVARQIANQYKGQTSVLYDIQLLPYCPCPELLDSDGNLRLLTNKGNTNVEYVPILVKDGTEYIAKNVMLWCKKSQLSFNINNTFEPSKENFVTTLDINLPLTWNEGVGAYFGAISVPDDAAISYKRFSKAPTTTFGNTFQWESNSELTITGTIDYYDEALTTKVLNETEMCRLVSPNYNGAFEFNPIKNAGVDYFKVDLRYKPYTPYIHVAPNFKNLYGARAFNDARGLICNGDFGIDTTSDAFAQYELQNKNYQNIFDRQIQNMDFNNKMALAGDIVGALTGAVSGGAGIGALSGSVGAGIGMAAASAVGGIADIAMNAASRKEQRQFTIDNFNMSIGNIKALPQSLSSVSSFNPNNEIFPILETYTCTQEEQLALKTQIELGGMSVNVMGTIGDYITNNKDFTAAAIIRMEGVDSNVIAEDISRELYKGVYI